MMTINGTEIGICTYGTELSIQDYSRKERAMDGTLTVIERGYTKIVNYQVKVKTIQASAVLTLLASKRAISVPYIGLVSDTANQYGVNVTGVLNNFTLTLESGEYSSLQLEVESGTPIA